MKENKEFWYWQGDGTDHLETLVCPVLIRPEALINLIDEARTETIEEIKKLGYHGRQNKMDGSWREGTYVFIPDQEDELPESLKSKYGIKQEE